MAGMKELVEEIAKALVDIPEQVSVREVEGEQVTVLELRCPHEGGAAGRGRPVQSRALTHREQPSCRLDYWPSSPR
jgi:nitrite reductase/ring-hydroxylating ferredoxin subunit